MLVVDEISMVGTSLLAHLHDGIVNGSQGSNYEAFGNVSVFFFRDFNQLEPVADVALQIVP